MKKITTKEFIEKAQKIHRNKYDYNEVEYINSHTKVKIFCNKCQKFFWQTPDHHLKGCGCSICCIDIIKEKQRKSTDIFIKQSIKIHGNKYDYSKVEYKNACSKVKIFCNKCQKIFEQVPKSHLRGSGCPYCQGLYKTTNEIIKEFQKIHGEDKYNYNEVKYINSYTKVKIFCNKCQKFFWQLPSYHLLSVECPNCCGFNKNVDEIIKEFQKIHDNKYDYSEVEYINKKTKVKIFCNKCKKYFLQTPEHHLRGQGCPWCQGIYKTKEQFIKDACIVHGEDKYNYNEVEYINSHTKVKIFCNKCQKFFWQTPTSHLSGSGCPYEKNKIISIKLSKNTNWFIQKAQEIHGYIIYDYSNVEYKDIYTKVKIFCNKCKKYFWQRPMYHLRKHGCPCCKHSKGEIKIKEILELNKINYISQKRFNDCKDKKPLPFDFYLPDYNICIEFQGKQHYNEGFCFFLCKYKKTEKALENYMLLKKHDKIKNEYCKNNNILLLEIKYNDNIEEKLNNIIKGNYNE